MLAVPIDELSSAALVKVRKRGVERLVLEGQRHLPQALPTYQHSQPPQPPRDQRHNRGDVRGPGARGPGRRASPRRPTTAPRLRRPPARGVMARAAQRLGQDAALQPAVIDDQNSPDRRLAGLRRQRKSLTRHRPRSRLLP